MSEEETRQTSIQRFGLNPEPSPDVTSSSSSWQEAWKAHWITFAIIFTLVGLYSAYSLWKSRNRKKKISRYLSFTVYSLLILLAITRVVFLLVYPQELKSVNFNKALQVSTRIIFRLGFPCLTASFAFIDLSFVDAVRGQLSRSRLRSVKYLAGVVGVHFAIDLAASGLTSFVKDTSSLYIVCVSYFIIVVVIIMSRITYSGRKILLEAKANQMALRDITTGGQSTSKSSEKLKLPREMKRALRKVQNVIIFTWISSLLTIAVAIFSLFSMGMLLTGDALLQEPWTWFIHQTFFRISELLMVGTILFALEPRNTDKFNCNFFSCCQSTRD